MTYKVGNKFEEIFTVSETVYQGFLETFKDFNPLHTNDKFAKEQGFQGRVMHGNILNGFISYFIGECLPDKNVILHSQTIQYKKPVYLNDKLVFTAQVLTISESVNAVEFSFIFQNKDQQVVSKGQIQIGLLS